MNIAQFLPEIDQALVFRFFISFSRFEYALKRSGFFKKGSGIFSSDAVTDWDKFAKTHRTAFYRGATPALTEACSYFERRPPRRQVVKNGELSWSSPLSRGWKPELDWFLQMVRRVRDNLFHGGEEESAGDSELLHHCLVIMETALSLNHAVQSNFNSPLESWRA
jgi:hypothetical protein